MDKKGIVGAAAPIFRDSADGLRVHISTRNSKLGNIPQFNLLPGSGYIWLKSGAACVDVEGTCERAACGGCDASAGGSCYAARSVRNYRETARAWADNTMVARRDPVSACEAIEHYCRFNVVPFFRFHTAGEFFDYRYFCAVAEMANRAKRWPAKTVFYAYTKRDDLANLYIREFGELPHNLVITLSEWGDSIPDNPHGLPVFAYDDGREDLAALPHCPAVDASGHATGITCAACLHCATAKPGDRWAVYAH